MAQKKVLITLNQPPFGSKHYLEGLRAAIGVISGIDEHKATVAYIGNGVYNALKGVNREEQMGHLKTLKAKEVKIYVERESLKERGIPEDNVYEQFKVIGRAELDTLARNVDHTIDF